MLVEQVSYFSVSLLAAKKTNQKAEISDALTDSESEPHCGSASVVASIAQLPFSLLRAA